MDMKQRTSYKQFWISNRQQWEGNKGQTKCCGVRELQFMPLALGGAHLKFVVRNAFAQLYLFLLWCGKLHLKTNTLGMGCVRGCHYAAFKLKCIIFYSLVSSYKLQIDLLKIVWETGFYRTGHHVLSLALSLLKFSLTTGSLFCFP